MPDPVSRLLADEHLPDPVTFRLRRLGHDVARMRDLCEDKSGDGDDDETVLKLAISQNRVVVTENCKDFLALHRRFPKHAGIIGSKQFFDWKDQAKQIDAAIRSILLRQGTLDGMYVRVPYDEPDESAPQPIKRRRRG
jgi:hypothetical protein